MGRRTRTLLPTTTKALDPSAPQSEAPGIEAKRIKAAEYHSHKPTLAPLSVGQYVRIQPSKSGQKVWVKGTVTKHIDGRSYEVTTVLLQWPTKVLRHLQVLWVHRILTILDQADLSDHRKGWHTKRDGVTVSPSLLVWLDGPCDILNPVVMFYSKLTQLAVWNLGFFPITDNKTSWSEQGLGAPNWTVDSPCLFVSFSFKNRCMSRLWPVSPTIKVADEETKGRTTEQGPEATPSTTGHRPRVIDHRPTSLPWEVIDRPPYGQRTLAIEAPISTQGRHVPQLTGRTGQLLELNTPGWQPPPPYLTHSHPHLYPAIQEGEDPNPEILHNGNKVLISSITYFVWSLPVPRATKRTKRNMAQSAG